MELNNLKFKKYFNSPDKEWIVFVHGIGGDSGSFKMQVRALKEHYNLLLPDLRGHGMSNSVSADVTMRYTIELIANDIFKIMDLNNIREANFIGGSFGAILIRFMEEMQPERFKKVILSGAVIKIKPSMLFLMRFAKKISSYFNNYMLYCIMAKIIMPKHNHSKSRRIFVKAARKVRKCEYQSWMVMLEDVNTRLNVLYTKPFITPTLMIMGDQDHAFLKDCKNYCDHTGSVQLEIIKKCGHLSNIDRFAEFNRISLNFLAS